MPHHILLVPVSDNAGLTTVTLSVIDALQSEGAKVSFFNPVSLDRHLSAIDNRTNKIVQELYSLKTVTPVNISRLEELMSSGEEGRLLEEIVANYELSGLLDETTNQSNNSEGAEVIVIEGLTYKPGQPQYVTFLNIHLAQMFNACVVLVAAHKEDNQETLEQQIDIVAQYFRQLSKASVLGCIVNKVSPGKKVCDILNRTLQENLLGYVPTKDNFELSREVIHEKVMPFIDKEWIKELLKTPITPRITPPFFNYQLIEKARRSGKRIILPEATEVRTLQAAAICVERHIAHCVLLGDEQEIRKVAKENNIEISHKTEIIHASDIIENYVKPMVELRKHKGLTEEAAREQLTTNMTILATMMMQQNEVDGLVSGALHTTANTIRPALQLIKTAPDSSLVSSLFFMCLPDEVLVYADCAVNPNPTAEELADIAIQSTESAARFGFDPKVALISYSTGSSGKGSDVEKVITAVNLAKNKRPDLCIDGPIQYDAATDPIVGNKKLPGSPVAGQANVFVFPDLDTGNTVYKAVQRTNHIICIGPMLQGLNKPVNDLSRGCTSEDIVYTIALTAVQAI